MFTLTRHFSAVVQYKLAATVLCVGCATAVVSSVVADGIIGAVWDWCCSSLLVLISTTPFAIELD